MAEVTISLREMILTTDPRLLAGALCVLGFFVGLPFVIMFGVAIKYRVSFLTVLSMKLRKVPPKRILQAYVNAREHDLHLELASLEVHFLAGGAVDAIVAAMIIAKERGWTVPYETFATLDLVGEDPVKRCKDAESPEDLQVKPS